MVLGIFKQYSFTRGSNVSILIKFVEYAACFFVTELGTKNFDRCV